MKTAISYGTRVWLGEMIERGWSATVHELAPVSCRYRLRLADDLDEQVVTYSKPGRVGVLVLRDAGDLIESGVFIPCVDADEARKLIDHARAETAA